jgi:hypothetical protein
LIRDAQETGLLRALNEPGAGSVDATAFLEHWAQTLNREFHWDLARARWLVGCCAQALERAGLLSPRLSGASVHADSGPSAQGTGGSDSVTSSNADERAIARDELAWGRASRQDTVAAYEAYLDDEGLPGRHVHEATARTLELENEAPAASRAPTFTPRVRLRASPAVLSVDQVKAALKNRGFFERSWNRQGRFDNDLVDNGDGTLTDRATGLMRQRAGSDESMDYEQAEAYVARLNRDGYAGHRD